MDTTDFINTLHDAIAESDDFRAGGGHVSIQNFADAMLLTADEGLVVRLPDGSEFQITVVQSAFTNDE